MNMSLGKSTLVNVVLPDRHGDGGIDSLIRRPDTDILTIPYRHEHSCHTGSGTLSGWTGFHGQDEESSEEDRTVFEHSSHAPLSLADTANLLILELRIAQRRWRSARIRVAELRMFSRGRSTRHA
jgi:hypothetical protein